MKHLVLSQCIYGFPIFGHGPGEGWDMLLDKVIGVVDCLADSLEDAFQLGVVKGDQWAYMDNSYIGVSFYLPASSTIFS